jgi:hypothetical protein
MPLVRIDALEGRNQEQVALFRLYGKGKIDQAGGCHVFVRSKWQLRDKDDTGRA